MSKPRDPNTVLLGLMDTWEEYEHATPDERERIDAERLIPVPEMFELLRAVL